MKRIGLIVIVVCGLLLTFRYLEKRNDGFSIENITTEIPNNACWDISVSKDEHEKIRAILGQPFYYLGYGFQCYAFVSQDDKYVLKFFRHQRLRPPVLYDWLPDTSYVRAKKEEKSKSRKERAESLFNSFVVAFQDVPKETGLIFVHLNKTANQYPVVTLHDKCGTKYAIPLDDKEFLLQHKALHCKPVIAGLMAEGRVEEAKRRIDQIFELLAACAKKGVVDTDGALISKNNLGFLADRAIYIDGGRLVRKSPDIKRDLKRLRPLYKWLVKEYPELATYFEQAQKQAL